MQLTTLANVKTYLATTTNNQDSLITALISRESALIEQWCGRTFPSVVNTNKRLNGTGTQRLVLPDNPILSVSSLTLIPSQEVVAASPDGYQTGYIYDDTCLYLIGSAFPRGYQNVLCSWNAGYSTTETAYVPTGNAPTLTPTEGGTALTVIGVTDDTAGISLTQVGSNPASGEFSFSSGVFTFNSAQYNHSVTMSYYYVPSPVEQACIEMVALDLQQRNNVGINSKTLANETVAYEKKGMTDSVIQLLTPYKRMAIA